MIPSADFKHLKPKETWKAITAKHRKGYNHDLVMLTSIWWLAIIQKPHIFKYIIRGTVYFDNILWM